MKLYLNEKQRDYLLEIFKVSKTNALNGKDFELASSFEELYQKIKPENVVYINLNRGEAESIIEFCIVISDSLEKALQFLKADTTRSEEELNQLTQEASEAKSEIDEILENLREKVRGNPV
jgi:flagellar motility protein MotE (MotC chaperone)